MDEKWKLVEIDSEERFEGRHIRFSQYMEDNLQLEFLLRNQLQTFVRFGTFINIMFKYIANVFLNIICHLPIG